MPFNGAGNFVSMAPPQYPAIPGEVIRAAYFNAVIDDLIAALSNTITRDGQSPPSSNLPMAGKRHTGAADGVAADEYATVGQLQALQFLQAGIGAVSRLAQDKMREFSTPADFGAVGDGVTDDTAELQAWASAAGKKEGLPLTYKVSGTITFPVNAQVDFKGMVIDASAGGVFTNSSVVYVSGTLTAIPSLSASPVAGSNVLAFSAPHTLVKGSVGLIYNPTNSSWNSSFTYSRAGEFFRVAFTPDTVTLKTSNPLYAGYASGSVNLYTLEKNQVAFVNLTCIAPDTGSIRPLRIRLATRVRLRNLDLSGSNTVNLDLDRCFDVNIGAAVVDNTVQAAAATYGLSIGNCQSVLVHDSQLNATRHAVNIGGDDFAGAVVNRDIRILGCTLRNDSALALVPCADIHANSEGVVYESNTIFGCGTWGGKDVAYTNNTFVSGDTAVGAMIQGGSQWVGGYAKAIGNTFKASGAYANGLIRLFVDTVNTVYDSVLIVENSTVSLNTTDVFARVDNNHATLKASASVNGVVFLDAASLSNVLRMSGTGTGDFAVVDNICNGKSGASLFVEAGGYVVARTRLMRQSGTVSAVLTSGSPVTVASVTWWYSYGSRAPAVQSSLDTRIVGTNPLSVTFRLKAAGGCSFDIFTTNNANAGATPTVNVDWSVGVSE